MQTELEIHKGADAISPGNRMRAALALAIVADLVQIAIFPLFIEGAASPADDLLDLGMAGALSFLLGWHLEFAPSFLAKLVPGVDFVPLWTLAVANVYRKSKKLAAEVGGTIEGHSTGTAARHP
jgi:hypothetical protein